MRPVLLCLVLCSCASLRSILFAPTAPADFPDVVRVKTPTRTFNSFFFYALDRNGRIWSKPKEGGDWTLMDLPDDERRPDFVKPHRLISINADQDELMAVSEEHRHYSVRWLENPVFKEETPPKVWADKHGWPLSGPYVWNARVAENRGWAVGRRTRNFAVFEDVLGRSFDGGGGLSTYYFLAKDGQQIDFADSGLPPDFSHTLCGPERSTFIAEAMQVAADTIMLINAYGEVRTRNVDFDTIGSDTMFFHYTYNHQDPPKDAIALPSEDWLEHARIPGRVSGQIAIVLTGKHNVDRELRVAGADSAGRIGVWTKKLTDATWTFVEAPELQLESFLDPKDVPRRAELHELTYEGTLDGQPVQLTHFSLECSPATLRIGDAEFTLHTVEKWTHLPRFDPGHDGTPKEFLVTLEPKGAVPPALKEHLQDFAFYAQATEDYLELTSREGPPLGIYLGRPGLHYPSMAAAKHDSLRHETFTLRALDKALQLDAFDDASRVRKVIAENERVARELAEEYAYPDLVDAQTPQWLSPAVLGALKVATGPSMIRLILPAMPFRNVEASEAAYYAKNLVNNLPPLLNRSREVHAMLQHYARKDLERAQLLIHTRIAAYEARLAKQKVTHFEELSGWWPRFGQQSAQAKFKSEPPPCKWAVDDRPIYEPERRAVNTRRPGPAGFFVTAECSAQGFHGTLLFRIVPTQFEADAFQAQGKSQLTTPVTVQLEVDELTPVGHGIAWLLPGSGRDPWDQELAGTLTLTGKHWLLKTPAVELEW
jgi:hypothetical protein